MKKNIYKYNKFDPKKNRSLYQYSSFHGKNFLITIISREKKLLKFLVELSKNYKILSKKNIKSIREFEVKEFTLIEIEKFSLFFYM